MDSKERHIRENESEARRLEKEARDNMPNDNIPGRDLLANGKDRRRNSTRKTNRLWLWLGVLVLIFILIWWLWTMGIIGDLSGTFNG